MSWINHFVKQPSENCIYDAVSIQNKRATNMDSLIVLEKTIDKQKVLLAVVCDGVGSLTHGAFAASASANALLGWFSTLETCENIKTDIVNEILAINSEIIEMTAENGFETACTLSVLLLMNNEYSVYHAGDSRIYLLEGDELQLLTSDDVTAAGALTACIGHEGMYSLQCRHGQIRSGTFLLCSDGLYKRMNMDYLKMKMKVRNKEEMKTAITDLADYVIQQEETDNISFAIVKIGN